MSTVAGRILVYGGKGALGSTIVNHFKSHNWWVGSIDMSSNDEAHANVIVTPSESWAQQESQVYSKVFEVLDGNKVEAIFCVAGGWAGGNLTINEFASTADLMWKQSVWTSLIAAKLASQFLKDSGLLTLTGAKAALEGTPNMIGYGMAKAAVHHLVKSLGTPKSGMPKNSTAVAILPITLDTPMNRRCMPKADFSSWTPLDFVAELMMKWVTEKAPTSGSLVQLITNNGSTQLKFD